MNPNDAGRRDGHAPQAKHGILLDFGAFSLTARLFDRRIAGAFFERLPVEVDLTAWGDELYGSVGADLGSDKPQPDIPPGGLAYTNRGNYLCIFFGQEPAWPVEVIGVIEGDGWKRLREARVNRVIVEPQPL